MSLLSKLFQKLLWQDQVDSLLIAKGEISGWKGDYNKLLKPHQTNHWRITWMTPSIVQKL
jgi:hypothetical protein